MKSVIACVSLGFIPAVGSSRSSKCGLLASARADLEASSDRRTGGSSHRRSPLPLQVAELEEPASLDQCVSLLLDRAPVPQDGADQARFQVRMHADKDVLHGGHVLEEADVLVGPGNPKAGNPVG